MWSGWIEYLRQVQQPFLLTPLPDYAPMRYRTMHTSALLPRVPPVRQVQVIRTKGNNLSFDIEARDMRPGEIYSFGLEGDFIYG
jgi:hypothetical protein